MMLKLMKYEWIKQKSSKLLLAGFLLLAELLFLFGVLTKVEDRIVIGIVFLALVSIIGCVFIAIEAIIIYYRDMKEKRGYLLFMTPNSMHAILGSKLMMSFITVVLWIVLVLILAFADVSLLVTRVAGVQELMNMFRAIMDDIFSVQFDWGAVVLGALYVIAEWATSVTAAFLAITISMTLLTRIKWKGLISFLIYIAIGFVSGCVNNLVIDILNMTNASGVSQAVQNTDGVIDLIASMNYSSVTIITLVVNIVICILCFWGTGTLLKKRLSL